MIPPELMALTPKQRDFVLAYVKTKNGTQSAREAGYKGTDNVLAVSAHHLLTNPKIVKAIESITSPVIERKIVSIERVINELADIGFADWRDFVKIKTLLNGEIEATLPLKDKIAALKLCGDHVGAFKAGEQLTTPQLQIDVHISEDQARTMLLSLLKR